MNKKTTPAVIEKIPGLRILALFLLFAGLAFPFPTSPAFAEGSPNEILAGVHKDFPPQYSLDEKIGTPAGFAIDTMDAIARRAGLKIRYIVFDDWPLINQALQEARIDIIPNIGIVKERKAEMDFTSPLETFNVSIFVRSTTTDIQGINDLRGRKVGVVTFNVGLSLIQAYGGAKPVIFKSFDEALLSLLSGNIDALVYPEPPALLVARRSKIEARIRTVGKPLLELQRAIAVRKGKPELLDILNKEISTFIATPEYTKIYAKWYGAPEPYWNALRVLSASGLFLALIIVIFTAWHYRTLIRLNRNLQNSMEKQKDAEETIRESEGKYHNLYRHSALGIFHSTFKDRFIDVNPALAKMMGYDSPEEAASFITSISEQVYAEPPKRDAVAAKAMETGGFISVENCYRRRDGTLWYGMLHLRIVHDQEGRPSHYEGLIEDITERKRAEEEERRNREAAERLAGEIAVVAEISRVIGSTLNIDEVYERVAGEIRKLIPFDSMMVNLINVEENALSVIYVSGMDIPARRKGDRIPYERSLAEAVACGKKGILIQSESAEDIVRRFPHLINVIQVGLISTISVPMISQDKVLGVLVFRSKTENAYIERDLLLAEKIGMQISGAIANAEMFNELSTTEKALREQLHFSQQLLDAIPIPIFYKNGNGIYLGCNAAFQEFVGLTNEQVVGKSVHEVFPQDLADVYEQADRDLFRQSGPQIYETSFLHADGSRHDIIFNKAVYVGIDGRTAGLVGAIMDITERKHADQERQRLEERLQRSEKMQALGQLAGGVAHDLNNVLGILTGYSELLLEEIPEASRSRIYVDKILQSTEKGAAIIQDLLTLARRGVPASDVTNLNDVVAGFLKTPVFEKMKDYHPGVTFRTEYDKNLLNIKGSPVHLEKTLMNLVSNAAESISGKGEVSILTESRYLDKPVSGYDEIREGDYAVLTVSDTGMGIPSESMGKIFEPFYTKKTMGRSGTGLGLAIVWGTVKDHNGYIDVQTKVGEGTTFTLYFPVTREELDVQQQKIPFEQYMGKGESVLVVDDVAEQRDVASRLLNRLGYKVHAVSSGEAAVEYIASNRADILVLDMIMEPGIDGLETYQRVLEINPKQKAILVSGFSETDRVKEAYKLGAGAYVKKPYIMEKLGLAIRDELNRLTKSL